ncbi:hypothetical protein [Puia sp.]|jgi:hypothetical protein|uniref:hypothetical protein n=1 Tax=Puia sp. TaxID=2045100 RepID=UPI002F41DBB9
MEPTAQSNLFELQIDPTSMTYLRDAAKWARFLAIAGFVFCGLFVVFAIIVATLLANFLNSMGTSPASGGMGAGPVAAAYIGIALVSFFPNLYLYNFGGRMRIALQNNDQEQLNIAFKNVRALFRFVGVLMIIGLGMFVLFLLLLLITAGRLNS